VFEVIYTDEEYFDQLLERRDPQIDQLEKLEEANGAFISALIIAFPYSVSKETAIKMFGYTSSVVDKYSGDGFWRDEDTGDMISVTHTDTGSTVSVSLGVTRKLLQALENLYRYEKFIKEMEQINSDIRGQEGGN
jgi:hypothetical protein